MARTDLVALPKRRFATRVIDEMKARKSIRHRIRQRDCRPANRINRNQRPPISLSEPHMIPRRPVSAKGLARAGADFTFGVMIEDSGIHIENESAGGWPARVTSIRSRRIIDRESARSSLGFPQTVPLGESFLDGVAHFLRIDVVAVGEQFAP